MSGKFVDDAGNYRSKEYFDTLSAFLCDLRLFVDGFTYNEWTMTVNMYITIALTLEVIASNWDNYMQWEGKSERDRPNRGLFWANGAIMRKKSSFSCLSDYFSSADVVVLQTTL